MNVSDVVLQTDSFTVRYECPSTFSTYLPQINFSTLDYETSCILNNLVVHLSSLYCQLYKNIWFVDI